MNSIDVCLSPALLPFYTLEGSVVVVIDIFRATSSICYGIDNDAKGIIPVASIPDIEERLRYKEKGYLLAAERNAQVVEGFDFGNSPFCYAKEKVEGKMIVLTTTNGTYAIEQARSAEQIVIGSFLNLQAICEYLSKKDKPILLLCSGWQNKVNMEDTLFAGAVVNTLKPLFKTLCDSSIMAEKLYLQAQHDLRGYISQSLHYKRLSNLQLENDIDFCLQINLTHSVPTLINGVIVKSSSN